MTIRCCGKDFLKMYDAKASLQAGGNDLVETVELMMQERREIITRANS